MLFPLAACAREGVIRKAAVPSSLPTRFACYVCHKCLPASTTRSGLRNNMRTTGTPSAGHLATKEPRPQQSQAAATRCVRFLQWRARTSVRPPAKAKAKADCPSIYLSRLTFVLAGDFATPDGGEGARRALGRPARAAAVVGVCRRGKVPGDSAPRRAPGEGENESNTTFCKRSTVFKEIF